MTEEWRDVPAWDGLYEVSSLGRVRRVGRGLMVGGIDPYGYRHVTLCRNGKGTTRPIHRMVAAAYLGARPLGLQVNHIDGDKLNNTPENLEYISSGDNTRHAIRLGLRDFSGDSHWSRRMPEKVMRGHRNGMAKLDEDKVREIRQRHAGGESKAALGRAFGVRDTNVHNVVTRRTWAHVT